MAKKKGNIDNLRPPRTSEEARERGRKGGIASGQARRRKKALLLNAQRVLESDMMPGMRATVEKVTGTLLDDEDTIFTAAVAVMAKQALGGDVRAFRELREIVRDIGSNVVSPEDIPDDPLSSAMDELAAEMDSER